MGHSIELYNKKIFYNKFYTNNIYNLPNPSVLHYVKKTDAYYGTLSEERLHFRAMRYMFKKYENRSLPVSWSELLEEEIKIISLPSNFLSDGLKPGTVVLTFSFGESVIQARDTQKNGVLYTPSIFLSGERPVGYVFYEYGVFVLYDNLPLSVVHNENYRSMVGKFDIQPVVYDETLYYPKWVYFFNIGNPNNANSCVQSRFIIESEIKSELYKKMFFVNSGQYNWSNSPVFYQRGGGVHFTDSFVEEVVWGEQISGVNGILIPKRGVSFNSCEIFNKSFKKTVAISLSRPLFVSNNDGITVKVGVDY